MMDGTNGGVFRATVVDTDDPEARGRVRFTQPAGDGEASDWAEVLVTGAPAFEPGTTVIVANEGGDPARPIVLGALASS